MANRFCRHCRNNWWPGMDEVLKKKTFAECSSLANNLKIFQLSFHCHDNWVGVIFWFLFHSKHLKQECIMPKKRQRKFGENENFEIKFLENLLNEKRLQRFKQSISLWDLQPHHIWKPKSQNGQAVAWEIMGGMPWTKICFFYKALQVSWLVAFKKYQTVEKTKKNRFAQKSAGLHLV